MNPMPLSFSRLNTFETCEEQFRFLHVDKLVQDQGNKYTEYGNRVHEALEKYGKAPGVSRATDVLADGTHLGEVKQYLPLVDRVLKAEGEKLFEFKMAIRRDRTPTGWFADDVWIRGIADVLVIGKGTAYAIDWKTGKVKANPTQLKLFALMVMAHFPAIHTVKTAFVWLAHGDITVDIYTRDQEDAAWQTLTPRFDAVHQAIDLGVFKPKPSGLCRWCAAKSLCSYARK